MTQPESRPSQGVSRDELDALRAEIQRELPPGAGRKGAEGPPARGGGKGNHGRWVGDVFFPDDEIIEQARALLADSWPPGDIKRALAKRFGGKGVSFKRHLSLARKRNLTNLGRTREESKSDSCQQWHKLLAEQRLRKARAEKQCLDLEAEIKTLQAAYDKAEGDDRISLARERLDQKIDCLERAEKRLASAMHAIVSHQHTIDRILGNLAPVEVKDVSDKEEIKSPKQPVTLAESEERLKHLLAKARGDVIQEAIAPSAN